MITRKSQRKIESRCFSSVVCRSRQVLARSYNIAVVVASKCFQYAPHILLLSMQSITRILSFHKSFDSSSITSFPPSHTSQIIHTRLLNHLCPVLPLTRHLREYIPHDLRTRHETMLLTFQNSNFALPHQLAQPPHIIDRNARVFGAVVNDDGPVNVFVAEPDGLLGFEADDEVGGGVCAGGCAVPDCEGEALVEGALAFAFGEGEGFEAGSFGCRVVRIRHRECERASVGKNLVHHQHGFTAVLFEQWSWWWRLCAGCSLWRCAFPSCLWGSRGSCALERGTCAAEEGGVRDSEKGWWKSAEEALRSWKLRCGW